jgi:hypothetical protein
VGQGSLISLWAYGLLPPGRALETRWDEHGEDPKHPAPTTMCCWL